MEYIIITPARNEERFIEHTIKSVLAQTAKPKKWIIVDDGSTDDTAAIVAGYAQKCDYIKLAIRDTSHRERMGGSNVVQAFYAGYDIVRYEQFDCIVKLDADLTLPSNYFEEVIRCFEMNPRVGLCGGYCTTFRDGKYVKESYSEDHVRGALKAYRRECFQDIGGLKKIWSWDGIDESAVAFHEWEIRVLPLPVIHHRPTTAEYDLLCHSYRTGREMYKERINLLSLFVISLVNAPRRPAIMRSVLYLLGYMSSWMNREAKVIDKDLGYYINTNILCNVLNKIGLSSLTKKIPLDKR